MKRLLLALALWALAGPALAVDSSTVIGNANYSALSTDTQIIMGTALTANRTITLPSAGATCIGQNCAPGASTFEVIDSSGNVGGANSCILVAPASGETINGSSSSLTLCATYGRIILKPMNGSSWWGLVLGAGQTPGTTTNDNAQAGYVGEIMTSAVTSSSTAPGLSSGTSASITNIFLTAGDWDCGGNVGFVPASTTTATALSAWTGTNATSAPTLGADTGQVTTVQWSTSGSPVPSSTVLPVPTTRVSLAAATTEFLMTKSTFGSSTMSAYGYLRCRRAR